MIWTSSCLYIIYIYMYLGFYLQNSCRTSPAYSLLKCLEQTVKRDRMEMDDVPMSFDRTIFKGES